MESQLVYAGTGHRLEILGGDRVITYAALKAYALQILPSYNPKEVISGMADGWDQALAEGSLELDIPFIAAVPFLGQESIWSPEAKEKYHRLLEAAKEVVIVCPGKFAPHKYHERDKWMVDRADKMLALWNGFKKGGTYSTIKYADKVKKPVLNVWQGWEEQCPK